MQQHIYNISPLVLFGVLAPHNNVTCDLGVNKLTVEMLAGDRGLGGSFYGSFFRLLCMASVTVT